MKIYEYENYEKYVEAQIAANIRKKHFVWVQKSTIEKIVNENFSAKRILCHGTRNAQEQKWFKEFLPDSEIIGTEISPTASEFPMTIHHDFHEEKEEWKNNFDIIYSNSFDHSCDPKRCLNTWRDQMKETGVLYIEFAFNDYDNNACVSDPLELDEKELIELCKKAKLELINSLQIHRDEEWAQCKLFKFKKPL